MGSRIDLEYARESGANFLSSAVLGAVQHRLDHPEPHQLLDEERLWSDLLSSMPLCFNLFGELWADRRQANVALKSWFPDHPGSVASVRFEWSPGRLDPAYLGNRSAFDVAFVLDLPGGGRGALGVETKYHEHPKAEPPPRLERLARYRDITEAAGIFRKGWGQAVLGTDLQQLWLDHLLALSMKQHRSAAWAWVRFALVYPAGNPGFADAADRYSALLKDTATFQARTIEELLATDDVLPKGLRSALAERYAL